LFPCRTTPALKSHKDRSFGIEIASIASRETNISDLRLKSRRQIRSQRPRKGPRPTTTEDISSTRDPKEPLAALIDIFDQQEEVLNDEDQIAYLTDIQREVRKRLNKGDASLTYGVNVRYECA
jgi:hypothetical protein